jgi:hypothetical protein
MKQLWFNPYGLEITVLNPNINLDHKNSFRWSLLLSMHCEEKTQKKPSRLCCFSQIAPLVSK